ncbi:hypothetical protein PSTT_12250, partial [Puccinia striiformis]
LVTRYWHGVHRPQHILYGLIPSLEAYNTKSHVFILSSSSSSSSSSSNSSSSRINSRLKIQVSAYIPAAYPR